MFYNDAKNQSLDKLKKIEEAYNKLGTKANDKIIELYNSRKAASNAIDRVERYINFLANSPKEFKKTIADTKLNIQAFRMAVKFEKESNGDNIKATSTAGGGVLVGGGIAAMGPTVAMAIATTFGTASTGTAIASLSGAAATNAALAWLGGGALAAGGGGMAAGNAFLALAGPVGWGIATTMVIGGGIFASIKNKEIAEKADKIANELICKESDLQLKYKKLTMLYIETENLRSALDLTLMVNTYPKNYLDFSEEQKLKLAALINNTRALGELINERII